MIKIAVDAMGGDNAPEAVVRGALAAAGERGDLEIVLVGQESRIRALTSLPDNVSLVPATEVIGNEEKPLMALRRKRDSSLVVGLQMLKEGAVHALVSAGNTGAFMAGASLIVGRIPGILKPALAPVLPTVDGRGTVALDIGATMDPKPDNLLQYARMGSLYAQAILDLARPRVGLLNVGVEPQKGNELAKEAYALLAQSSLNFVGNIEAREVMEGKTDVLICDGFTGNVLLKSMEGVAQALFSQMKSAISKGGVQSKLGALLLKNTLQALKDKLDYSQHGGSPLLGINGVCIKCHGSADATTVKNAVLKQAYLLAKGQTIALITKITEG